MQVTVAKRKLAEIAAENCFSQPREMEPETNRPIWVDTVTPPSNPSRHGPAEHGVGHSGTEDTRIWPLTVKYIHKAISRRLILNTIEEILSQGKCKTNEIAGCAQKLKVLKYSEACIQLCISAAKLRKDWRKPNETFNNLHNTITLVYSKLQGVILHCEIHDFNHTNEDL